MNLLRFTWRNLWRNYRRTLITLSAVSVSTFVLTVSYAMMAGLMEHAVGSATNVVVGEAQIHAPGYLADRSLYKTVPKARELMEKAKSHGIGMTPRSYGYGLAASGTKSAGALFWGIEPLAENDSFDLGVHLQEGSFLTAQPKGTVVVGSKLARSLDLKLDSEIVVVVQAADGSLGNELYHVAGILKAAGERIDRNAVLLHQADYDKLFATQAPVHELALNSRGKVPLEELRQMFAVNANGLEFKTWRELLPMLSDMMNVFEVAVWIFGSIFFMVGALGVLNTMLMATFERTREFGILKALGTPPWRIVLDVTAEALLLGLMATFLGAVVGALATTLFYFHGIDTSWFAGHTTIAGVAFDPIWKTVFRVQAFVLPIVSMLVACILAALYPAILAARLNPVQAIHHT